jgi:hypothetical protein
VAGEANEEQCPLLGRCEDALTKICIEDATKLVEIVQKWSDEHPKKTYAPEENIRTGLFGEISRSAEKLGRSPICVQKKNLRWNTLGKI